MRRLTSLSLSLSPSHDWFIHAFSWKLANWPISIETFCDEYTFTLKGKINFCWRHCVRASASSEIESSTFVGHCFPRKRKTEKTEEAKKKEKERGKERKATSTPSDTLPFKDHSATDRKGVPLNFTASSPLPPPLLARDMPFSSYTPVTLLLS